MIGLIVPQALNSERSVRQEQNPRMDPLSEVLSLMKPQTYVAGGFSIQEDVAIFFPKHQGIKCYAMLAGCCWLVVEGINEPVKLQTGDCFLLPRGLPFQLTTDLSLKPVHYSVARARNEICHQALPVAESTRYIAGGHFGLSGGHTDMLLRALPPIVHIQSESGKASMRWSLERMHEELREPQPGGSLMAQQLAYTMLIQALRLHLSDTSTVRRGWLAALSDQHMSLAITKMHNEPGHTWTVQSLAECVGMSRSVFSEKFREIVGLTPMEYLTRWRMFLAANRLEHTSDSLSTIAQSLGYVSDSAFGKAFRRIMGTSPRHYVRQSQL